MWTGFIDAEYTWHCQWRYVSKITFYDNIAGGGTVFFHDTVITILILITLVVSYAIIWGFVNKSTSRVFENQTIELWWTIIPAVILFGLGFQSLRLLYLLEDSGDRNLTLKCVGHQWYWSYEYGDEGSVAFDSYIVPTAELETGDPRLLDVDNRVVLPANTNIRVLVTSADVIHSWAVPALRVKIDAVPGRLNQTPLFSFLPSILYGQCSEICGANHSFMPIVVEMTNLQNFSNWLNAQYKVNINIMLGCQSKNTS